MLVDFLSLEKAFWGSNQVLQNLKKKHASFHNNPFKCFQPVKKIHLSFFRVIGKMRIYLQTEKNVNKHSFMNINAPAVA